MPWEPRDENKARFDELDAAITEEQNIWLRKGFNRAGIMPDMLRLSQRVDSLVDLLEEAGLIDRDKLVLLAMEKELKLIQDTRSRIEEAVVTPKIVTARTIPKGKPRG